MPKNQIIFSVIIPALNEEVSIGKCIESLQGQDFDGSYEIIIVDNGSTDDTVKVASSLGVKVVSETKKGQVRALITGCKSAEGIFYVFTDSDTILPSDWLSRIYSDFNSKPTIVAVGGPYVFHDANLIVNSIVESIAIPIYRKVLFKRFQSIPSANMAVKASTYRDIGGFDPKVGWGFDVELCNRLKGKGIILFDGRLLVFTSFRRYEGQSSNPFVKIAHSIKEIAVQTYRLRQVATKNGKFKQQKLIRKSSESYRAKS